MLQKLISNFKLKRVHFVMEETDVTTVLGAINSHHKCVPDMRVGNCGWADDTNKWFIHFTTTNSKWELIRDELKVVRVYGNMDIPKDTIGTIYSTD